MRRPDDVVIVRRAGSNATTKKLHEVFGVLYAGHLDIGSECETLEQAEHKGREIADANLLCLGGRPSIP